MFTAYYFSQWEEKPYAIQKALLGPYVSYPKKQKQQPIQIYLEITAVQTIILRESCPSFSTSTYNATYTPHIIDSPS